MRRLGLTFVAAFCLAAMTFAAGNQPTTAKWEGNINVNKLSQYLNLNSVQSEEVSNICEYFTEQIHKCEKGVDSFMRRHLFFYHYFVTKPNG